MPEERVYFPVGEIQLEGLLNSEEAFSCKGGAIFCHPHPQFGGNMNNPVITASVDAARMEGWMTLRFNFRGVGDSGGNYDEGNGEKEDVRAAIDYLSSIQRNSSLPFVLLGYSFGAWTGVPVAVADRRITGWVAISPPLAIYPFDFLSACKKKKLVLAGEKDEWCPSAQLEEWYSKLEDPKSLTVIQGADHFFFSQARRLIEPLQNYFRSDF